MKGKSGHRVRRHSALELLTEQLKRGQKSEKVNGKTTNKMIPHTEKDKKRIEREIESLKKKINKGMPV